jgi:UDP-N-acetylmuramoyl-tripeptide--D-alanyl-D-alanine ligase
MDIFVPKFIQYQLYLLQLENYELRRYWKLLFKKGFWPKKKQPQRKELVWTAKAKAIMLMAWALHGLVIVLAGLITLTVMPGIDNFFTTVVFAVLILLPFYFILFSLVLIVLKPLDALAKKNLVSRAKFKILNLQSEITIIGVAGSYGKTTMKEVLSEVLGSRFKVQATPESVNTPVGIARWVLNKVTDDTRIIIVEMGEHYQNDIKDICDIASPDIAVVTGINESHLERMKNMETVVATVFEIVGGSKQGATVVLNSEDRNVMQNYQKFVWPDHKIVEFSAKGGSAFGGKIEDLRLRVFSPERLCWDAEADGLGKIEIHLLGEYALADVSAAIKIGKILGMSGEELKRGIQNIKPVEHRLQPMPSPGNVLVIDDSYNGNPDGVREAVKVLSRFTNRRKLVITPGLVEMGESSPEVHREIGRELASTVDVVILVKNSVTGFIEEGLLSRRHSEGVQPTEESQTKVKEILHPSDAFGVQDDAAKKPQIIWFDSALEAHAVLKNILKPGDVILFQNDWGDQYV